MEILKSYTQSLIIPSTQERKIYKKMLVPLDGSELAEVVFPYAKELAGKLDLDIILLNVYSPEEREFASMHQAYIERVAETIKHQSQEVQQKTGVQPESKSIEVWGKLTVGYPAEEILRYTDENAVDLILMATHGRSGISRWAMGSVADKVLRASNIPVWLVHAGISEEVPYDQWPKETIVVPLDGSEFAESVLPHVAELAKQRSTKPLDIILLRVCEPPLVPFYYTPEDFMVPLNWGEYDQQEITRDRQVAHEYLAEIERWLEDISVSVQSEVLHGKAADTIVDYINRNPYNIIVMATHGRSGFGQLVFGSVAERVLHEGEAPLLLVRPY